MSMAAVQPSAAGDAGRDTPVMLSARGLRKEFGGFVAVNNVDLDVHHARVHALIGPNGAGKTTVFNLLTKFLQPTAGSIRLLDHDITHTDPAKVARMGLVRSFQISAVFPHLSVLDNVRVALQRPGGLATQFWLPMRSLNRLNERAMQLIESVGLADKRHDDARTLFARMHEMAPQNALILNNLAWTAKELDRFLADPEQALPRPLYLLPSRPRSLFPSRPWPR